jgi:hypothetical protein
MGKTLGDQAAQAVYKIIVTEKYVKINDLSGTITFDKFHGQDQRPGLDGQ